MDSKNEHLISGQLEQLYSIRSLFCFFHDFVSWSIAYILNYFLNQKERHTNKNRFICIPIRSRIFCLAFYSFGRHELKNPYDNNNNNNDDDNNNNNNNNNNDDDDNNNNNNNSNNNTLSYSVFFLCAPPILVKLTIPISPDFP